MRGIYKKGADFERSLVNLFWERGWAALRVAGSGSTSHSVPDILAIKDNHVLAIECKVTAKDRLSIKKAVEGLKNFTYRSGAKSFIAIRFYGCRPRFYDLLGLIVCGNYTIKKSDPFLSLDAIIGEQTLLDS